MQPSRQPQWLIVNTYRNSPPGGRRLPYTNNNEAELEDFTQNSRGLVVPTTALFQLLRDIDDKIVSPQDARALLF